MIDYIACMFMLYSIIGWIWETSYVSVKEKRFVNRGFLRSPVIPIYGFAATTVMISMVPIQPHLPQDPILSGVFSILYIAFIATGWEYVTSYGMEVIFKTRWWDYTTHRFNINGRVALDASLFWGIGGFILWRYINVPLTDSFETLSHMAKTIIFSVFYIGVSVDATFTLKELIDLRTVVIKLHDASEEAVDLVGKRFEQFQDSVEQIGDELEAQRSIWQKRLDEAREEFKRKAQYSRFEGMRDFGRFVEAVIDKGESIAEENEARLRQYGEMLKKLRGHARFFRSYPNAATRSLSAVLFAKRKEKSVENNKIQNTDVTERRDA